MKFPLGWIAEYLDLPADPEEVASAYTLSGSEVEGRETAEGEPVFDFNLTVNRPDCMNVYGLAREGSCLFGKPLKPFQSHCEEKGPPIGEFTSVRIEAPDLCPRYGARLLTGVNVGESPEWIQRRLRQCGLRPVNAVVDITNYVLLELGHPLHAFDLNRLSERRIVVRRARTGEKMLFLDGVERPLSHDHLVIADADRAVALAGIMGGEETGVTLSTRDILLEGAIFDPISIRRTSKALGIRTDASHRFERGVDWEGPKMALDRCARLIQETCGGTLATGILDVCPGSFSPAKVRLRHARVEALLGIAIPPERCEEILKSLGFGIAADGPGAWMVTAPSCRVDISREADLVEEIMRVRGLADLPAALPHLVDPVGGRPEATCLEESLRDAFAAVGFREAIHMSMTDPALCEAAAPGTRPLRLANPLTPAASVLRTSLLPPLLAAIARNRSRGARRVALFEVGRVYLATKDGSGPQEEARAALALFVDEPSARWGTPGEEGLLHIKGRMESALNGLGFRTTFHPSDAAPFAPGHALEVKADDKAVGRVGTISPSLLAEAGVKSGTLHYGEISLDRLGAAPEPRFKPFSKYPPVVRDFSFLVPCAVPWDRIRGLLEGLNLEHLLGLKLVDVYEGKGIPEGMRSWTFSLVFQSIERTLTEEDIAPLTQRVAGAVSDALSGVQR